MNRYVIVDTANLFFRCLHVTKGDAYEKSGLALHLIFRSIKKMWRDFGATHVVFAMEGKSWRYDIYPMYKRSRKVAASMRSKSEMEDDAIFMEAFAEFTKFLTEKTNTTVLRSDRTEGDDFIARWIQNHPDDNHIIVSGDTDFIQMLADNVIIYDGVRNLTISKDSILNEDGNPVHFSLRSSGKLKIGKEIDLMKETFEVEDEWWKRALFLKCMRGDSGDGIFSAYPKVRETKLNQAWSDRAEQGYNWNNLMLQTWDKDGELVKVIDEYNMNKTLIDLTQQPLEVKDLMDDIIIARVTKSPVSNVGVHFLRFCEANGLVNLIREATDHAVYLNSRYAK